MITSNEIILMAIGGLIGGMIGFSLCAMVYGALLILRGDKKDGQR